MALVMGTPLGAEMAMPSNTLAPSAVVPAIQAEVVESFMTMNDSPSSLGYHRLMEEKPGVFAATRRWWLMPMVVGIVVTAAILLLGDFRPVVERFYSVF